jgi:hypothetical protein
MGGLALRSTRLYHMMSCVAAGLLLFASCQPAHAQFADYTTIPNGSAASYSLGGTTVTGSNLVTSGSIAGIRGLGILGGIFPPTSDLSLDLGETMTIDYNQLVTDVFLTLVDIDPPGNVIYSFEAFDGATSLGTFPVPPHVTSIETKNLSLLAGNQDFTRITLSLSASAPAGLQIQSTSYHVVPTAVPEPGNLALLAGTAVVFLGMARRRRRSV